jgi:phosphatidylserine/phosphatidylglycerophosphate/cardiolipin synthase-like enzyme
VAEEWFLSPVERGNPDTEVDTVANCGRSWTEGNLVRALVDGAEYFQRLLSELEALERGDELWFLEWRGDRDELLSAEGPTVGTLLASLAGRGVDLRGLLWRSHPRGQNANRRLEAVINHSGGQVLLDQRVLPFGSHHQKLVIVRRRDGTGESMAFVGGIDICHGRRDDGEHNGDPQPMDRRYGPRAPWHDLQLEVRGPAVAQLEWCFRERWADPAPLDDPSVVRALLARLSGEPRAPSPLPAVSAPPPRAGSQAVQVLRTYPRRHRAYPFARHGELSAARALIKAIGRAERLIYIEDQYLWSREIAEPLAARLESRPALNLIVVLSRWPHRDGILSGPPNRIGQLAALARLHQAGGSRVGAYDIENRHSVPIYVHAKACVIDDVWAMVGSANFNLRSWTHDSELSCAILDSELDRRAPEDPGGRGDGARVFARSLRLRLWSEHLGRSAIDPAMLDLRRAPELWRQSADEVSQWHRDGATGPHPRARVTRHSPAPLSQWSRWWAEPIYRTAYDPDGRGRVRRRLGIF